MDERQWLTERFERHRSHLRAVAYRMGYPPQVAQAPPLSVFAGMGVRPPAATGANRR